MKLSHSIWILLIEWLLLFFICIIPGHAAARTKKEPSANRTMLLVSHKSTLPENPATRLIEAPEYKGLAVSQGIQVILEERTEIEIEADKEVLDRVRIEVNPVGQVLEIGLKSSRSERYIRKKGWSITINEQLSRITVRVPIHNGIHTLTAASEAGITTRKALSVKHLAIDLSGAASLHAAVRSEQCTMILSGASRAHLAGRFSLCGMELHGASKVECKGSAARWSGEVSGASKFEGDLTAEQILLEISGASRVELEGQCDSLRVRLSSASRLDTREMAVSQGNITASGASKAQVYCTGSLDASASGNSVIKYKGECRVSKRGAVYKD